MRLFLWLALAAAQLPSDNAVPLTPPLLRDHFVQAIADRNLDDLLALFTSDATVTLPNTAPANGASAVRTLFSGQFDRQDASLTLSTPTHYDEGEPHHPTAIVDTGHYTESLRLRSGGSAQRQCGAYTFRYTKNPEGGWLIARMDWTSEPCAAR